MGISSPRATPMNPIQLDTTQAATDTIQYVATDQTGLTSTTTRTVIIEAETVGGDLKGSVEPRWGAGSRPQLASVRESFII